MKTSIEFELEPFSVPEYVNTKHSNKSKMDSVSLPLKSLSVATLEELCTQFRATVFRKALNSDAPFIYHTQ